MRRYKALSESTMQRPGASRFEGQRGLPRRAGPAAKPGARRVGIGYAWGSVDGLGNTHGAWISLLAAGGVLALAGLLDVTRDSASLGGISGPHCLLGRTLGEGACPGCGLTRGTALAVQGEWSESFASHPAGIVVALLCAAGILVHSHILIGRRRRRSHTVLIRVGQSVFVVAIATAWLVRLT